MKRNCIDYYKVFTLKSEYEFILKKLHLKTYFLIYIYITKSKRSGYCKSKSYTKCDCQNEIMQSEGKGSKKKKKKGGTREVPVESFSATKWHMAAYVDYLRFPLFCKTRHGRNFFLSRGIENDVSGSTTTRRNLKNYLPPLLPLYFSFFFISILEAGGEIIKDDFPALRVTCNYYFNGCSLSPPQWFLLLYEGALNQKRRMVSHFVDCSSNRIRCYGVYYNNNVHLYVSFLRLLFIIKIQTIFMNRLKKKKIT